MAVLVAVAGPIKGAFFRLPAEEVTIGRHTSCLLCIGDLSVSRKHCVIQCERDTFRIRDLGSNNGTFVNDERFQERVLAYGDKIRIGDTVLHFAHDEYSASDTNLALQDNGVAANKLVQTRASDSAETAIRRLFASTPQSTFGVQARTLLRIGAALNAHYNPETLELELLKQILGVVPASQAAIVQLSAKPNGEPTVTGWNRHLERSMAVPVSRTLIADAVSTGNAIFSDDLTCDEKFAELSSLTRRRVDSVIVVPLATGTNVFGAIYIDSADASQRLNRDHLGIVAAIAECAGTVLARARFIQAVNDENRNLRNALQLRHNLIGSSSMLHEVAERIAKIARTDATVIIRGETGTGKELAAQAIHQNSLRAGRPFEAINCSLLRDTLLESELFGHERGSFTGAIAQKRGKLELADGGTLFLDELGELGQSPQAMLLRVLQTREFQRLGGTRPIGVDIRIVAATNENLEQAVKNKTFRQDLYYRLNVVSISMPALRERREDIPLLADHFIRIYSRKNKRLVTGLSREAMAILMRHEWPGNVRELENAIEHAIVFGSTHQVLPEDLPELLLVESQTVGDTLCGGYHHAVRKAKQIIVRSAVERACGNYSEAAKELGIHVNNLHRLMRELNLKPAVRVGDSNS
jgi:transcriptional regulator with GAF, ATPase, and Fis domain